MCHKRSWCTRVGRAVAIMCAWLLAAALAQSGRAEVVDPNLWGADGDVLAIAPVGNTIYIAGSFRSVGPNSGGGVPLDAGTAASPSAYPRVTGIVWTVVADGHGGWFIGGTFSTVGGQPRQNLAHIGSSGADANWRADVDGKVATLALAGNILYVGGEFGTVGGKPRHNIAAVSASTGASLPWAPDASDSSSVYGSRVSALAVSGDTIYVGGRFDWIGGARRWYIAALDSATGLALEWAPDADAEVMSLTLGDSTVYAGGSFFSLGGARRWLVGAVDARTGRVTPWDPHGHGYYTEYTGNSYVSCLLADGDRIFVAGNFDSIGGAPRGGLAALDVGTGTATVWNPISGPRSPPYNPPGSQAMTLRGGALYVGGWFSTMNGQDRQSLAAFDATSGALLDWNPHLNGVMCAVGAQGNVVYAGGQIALLGGWRHRAGLAALDAATGQVKPWNPNPDGSQVRSMVIKNGAVYVSGNFSSVGGQPRSWLAAVDTLDGQALPWNPGANDVAMSLVPRGDTLYMCGYFTQVAGQSRPYLAAVTLDTGVATSWNPVAGGPVFSMVLGEQAAYVGGLVYSIGGVRRDEGAAVDLATGAPTPFNLNTGGGIVHSLLLSGSTLFVVGNFGSLNGVPRTSIGSVDAETGQATAWNPDVRNWSVVYPQVYALALRDSDLWVGGDFSALNGQSRFGLGALDVATGATRGWDPGTDARVLSLTTTPNGVYAGGMFSQAGGLPCNGLAAILDSLPTVLIRANTRAVSLGPISPNPVRSEAAAVITLGVSLSVDVALFDVQGRRIATLLDGVALSAGPHLLSIHPREWPSGVCFLRVRTALGSAVRKMLLVK
jgi:trimeric autotransporter adhesin